MDWNLGPDNIFPTNSYTSNRLTDPVKLRLANNNREIKPISLYTLFKYRAISYPDQIALVVKRNNETIKYTYENYWNLCNQAAKSFIKLGLNPGYSVSILGFNSPEWMISLYGAIFAAGVGSGIYTTNTPEACEHVINDSMSQIVVVENNDQLKKILKIKDNCKYLKSIVQYTGEVQNSHNGLVKSWKNFLELSSSISDDELNGRIKKIAPNKCASLIYTSGTTGSPKAAMLSHDNIYYCASFCIDLVKMNDCHERIVSFLPLNHIAGQLCDIYVPVLCGATVYFAQPDAMKGSLATTLAEVKPTMFIGVPRVFEKMQDKIIQMSKTGAKVPPEKIKHLLGFGECEKIYSGAAPIKRSTLEFFKRINIEILEVFGMSESTGAHCLGLKDKSSIGSVGSLNPYNQTKIINADNDGNGEICMYGRHVFMGYLNSEKKTQETIDKDGWLLTGDIGKFDSKNFLYVTGRLKELIITAGGENISPVAIENAIIAQQPELISNCMAIGDRKNYLTLLVALKSKLDPNTTASLDELSDETIDLLKRNGSNITKVSEVLAGGNQTDFVYNSIQAAIEKANINAISNAAKIQKFKILPRDFSIATGELGPTLKLRRQIVLKMYEALIEAMYA